jgi:CBS domain-containing protein
MQRTVDSLIAGQELFSVAAESNVLDVARFMVEKRVGAVVVLADGRLAGIFSERDLMKRVVVAGREAAATPVADVMTKEVVTGLRGDTYGACIEKMRARRCRHLPVVDADGRPEGMVSLRDLLQVDLSEKAEELEQITAYVTGLPTRSTGHFA